MKKLLIILSILVASVAHANNVYKEDVTAMAITTYTDKEGKPVTGTYIKEEQQEGSSFTGTYTVVNGLAHGPFTEITTLTHDKITTKGTYNNGKKDGTLTITSAEKTETYTYVNGVLHGDYTLEQGNYSQKSTYSQGVMEKMFVYHKNRLDSEYAYKNGVKHGPFMRYYPDNTIKVKGEYLDGQIQGDVCVYDTEQELVATVIYKNNKPLQIFCFGAEEDPKNNPDAYGYDLMGPEIEKICTNIFG